MRVKPAQMVVGASVLLAACAVVGCEFVLGDLPAASDTQSTTGSTASTGGASTGSGGGGTTTQGGGTGGNTTTTTSNGTTSTGGGSTGSGGEGGCCDCDHDSHLAQGPCGGDDCDDHDPSTYPGADYSTDATAKGGYDHNCNGVPEPNPLLNVSFQCGLVGLPCKQKSDGFLAASPPPCGMPADWGNCQGTLIPCTVQIIEPQKKMACK